MVTFALKVTPAMSNGAPQGRPRNNTQTFRRRRRRRRRAPERRSAATGLAEAGGRGHREASPAAQRSGDDGCQAADRQAGGAGGGKQRARVPAPRSREPKQAGPDSHAWVPCSKAGEGCSSQAAVKGRRSPRTGVGNL